MNKDGVIIYRSLQRHCKNGVFPSFNVGEVSDDPLRPIFLYHVLNHSVQSCGSVSNNPVRQHSKISVIYGIPEDWK